MEQTSKRTFDTAVREPWNPAIKTCLDSIDKHVSLHLRTGDVRHLRQAQILREYVSGLKEWIRDKEK